MKIILSPAKKMITDTDSIEPVALPEFIDKTTELLSWLKDKSKEYAKCIEKYLTPQDRYITVAFCELS